MMKKNLDYMLANIEGDFYISNGVKVFKINRVSAEIYKEIDGKQSIENIGKKLTAKYNLSIEDSQKDLLEIIRRFKELEIIK